MRVFAHLGVAIRSVPAVILAPCLLVVLGVLAQGLGDVRRSASALPAGGLGNRLGAGIWQKGSVDIVHTFGFGGRAGRQVIPKPSFSLGFDQDRCCSGTAILGSGVSLVGDRAFAILDRPGICFVESSTGMNTVRCRHQPAFLKSFPPVPLARSQPPRDCISPLVKSVANDVDLFSGGL
jgi:hypothetical protein